MIEAFGLTIVTGAGALLGLFFFAGLRWTVVNGLAANNPALWFVGSLWLRLSLVVAGFCLVCQSDWRRFVMCLVGFHVSRVWVTRPSFSPPAAPLEGGPSLPPPAAPLKGGPSFSPRRPSRQDLHAT